jgi:hypothetical protein
MKPSAIEPGFSYITWLPNGTQLTPHQIDDWIKRFKATKQPWEWLWVETKTSKEPVERTLPRGIRSVVVESGSDWPKCLPMIYESFTYPTIVTIHHLEQVLDSKEWSQFIERINRHEPMLDRSIELVNGSRNHGVTPRIVLVFESIRNSFFQIALNLSLPARAGWPGYRLVRHQRLFRFLFGVQFHDPYSGFKAFQRDLLKRFPIQSTGDLGWVEFLAKTNFLGTLMDELPLKVDQMSQQTNPSWQGFRWGEVRQLFSYPIFHNPKEAIIPEDSKLAPVVPELEPGQKQEPEPI